MMNKIKIGGLMVLLALVMSACVSATVDAPDVCSTNDLGAVPAAPVSGVTVPPLSFSTSSDFSDVLGKVKDVSDQATVSVSQFALGGDSDLSWITRVDVSVKGDSPDLPETLFASSNGSASGTTLPLQVQMDSDTTQKYLNHPVTLTFTVSGVTTTQTVKLTNTLCVDANGKFSKSL